MTRMVCECGCITEYDDMNILYNNMAETFLKTKTRGVTCQCGKVHRAETVVMHAYSWAGMICIKYDWYPNEWSEKGRGPTRPSQPPILSIDMAFHTITDRTYHPIKATYVYKRSRKQAKRIMENRRKLNPRKVYLKPWKDPESLFCSPRLKEILKKELGDLEECKEK